MSDQNIKAIVKELEEYTVVKCDLAHEKVRLDKDGKPIFIGGTQEVTFLRNQLCRANIRKKRLGCAHSISNQRFIQTLKRAEVTDPKFNELVQSLEAEIMKVYAIDHKKGDLEKSLALSYGNSIEKDRIHTQLDHNTREHRKIIDRIVEIKTSLIEMFEYSYLQHN